MDSILIQLQQLEWIYKLTRLARRLQEEDDACWMRNSPGVAYKYNSTLHLHLLAPRIARLDIAYVYTGVDWKTNVCANYSDWLLFPTIGKSLMLGFFPNTGRVNLMIRQFVTENHFYLT